MLDQSTNVSHSIGGFEQMPEVAAQSYLGSLDYGPNMALDPSFFAVDDEVAAFGSMLDDFATEQVEENRD